HRARPAANRGDVNAAHGSGSVHREPVPEPRRDEQAGPELSNRQAAGIPTRRLHAAGREAGHAGMNSDLLSDILLDVLKWPGNRSIHDDYEPDLYEPTTLAIIAQIHPDDEQIQKLVRLAETPNWNSSH